MKKLMKFLFYCFMPILVSRCGIVEYPGQQGLVTSNYAKLDLEVLEEPGLFVYESVYDNRVGGQGVGAIVTKLYPGAKTYTSNVRTNADGTLFRSKSQYEGAVVQAIVIPSLQQIHLNPNHQLAMMIGYDTSLDEIDEQNIAEKDLFKIPGLEKLNELAFRAKKFRWDILRAATLSPQGLLSYEVSGIQMQAKKFTPSKAVTLETNFLTNSLHSNLTAEVKAELVQFLESQFPKGYRGTVHMQLKSASQPVSLNLSVHTMKTLENAGYKIIRDADNALADEILKRFKNNSK